MSPGRKEMTTPKPTIADRGEPAKTARTTDQATKAEDKDYEPGDPIVIGIRVAYRDVKNVSSGKNEQIQANNKKRMLQVLTKG